MNKLAKIKTLFKSDFVNMGPIRLRQPIPNATLEQVDPFILLHHYGPYKIDLENNPFDLGPHPHRGFEPITFLIKGEQLHRDSLGNESIVKAGDVQWTTAGRGVIHAEGPTKEFIEKGGELEGIQLWLNLPSEKKMIPANYQHIKADQMPEIISDDKKIKIKVISGTYKDKRGLIKNQTAVNAYFIDLKKGADTYVELEKDHQSMIYLLHGKAELNKTVVLTEGEEQLAVFDNEGSGFNITALENSLCLFLSGQPINEPIASWGPYVMNTQTEIMEALRDFQQGKMGYLSN